MTQAVTGASLKILYPSSSQSTIGMKDVFDRLETYIRITSEQGNHKLSIDQMFGFHECLNAFVDLSDPHLQKNPSLIENATSIQQSMTVLRTMTKTQEQTISNISGVRTLLTTNFANLTVPIVLTHHEFCHAVRVLLRKEKESTLSPNFCRELRLALADLLQQDFFDSKLIALAQAHQEEIKQAEPGSRLDELPSHTELYNAIEQGALGRLVHDVFGSWY